MANYSLTSSSVFNGADAAYATYTAGASISAGQPVYLDAADLDALGQPKAKLADANAATTAAVVGIAANTAANNQPVRVVSADSGFTHGLTGVAAGDIIILSATAGGLAPAADMASTMFPVVCMLATSATKAKVAIAVGLAAKA